MQEAHAARPELEPYTVVWHQKGEKPYVIERYKTPTEANKRLVSLWAHGHREATGSLTGRTDFAIALVWRSLQRDLAKSEERRQAVEQS